MSDNLLSKLQALENGDQVNTEELGTQVSQEFQGDYECAFFFEGGNGLLHSYEHCKKNKDHKEFMPVKKFLAHDFNCLPEGFKKPVIFNFVKHITKLTVKLIVKHVSRDRPNLHPRTKQNYIYGDSKLKKMKMMRAGTGTVVKVEKKTPLSGEYCQCDECKSIGNQSREWYSVTVATACHVVYDQHEADETKIMFSIFFDGEEKKFTLPVGQFIKVNSDACLLMICTHDDSLSEELDMSLKDLQDNRVEVMELFKLKDKSFLPIVSHPHGMDKQVSFGFILHEVFHNYRNLPGPLSDLSMSSDIMTGAQYFSSHGIVYNTPTCEGSSGAFIFHTDTMFKFLTGSIHEGSNRVEKYNYSGDSTNLEQILRDPDELPSKSEVQQRLNKYLKGYKNNPSSSSDDFKSKKLSGAQVLMNLRQNVKEYSDQKALLDLRETAKGLPKGFNVTVTRKIDDERNFDFRRSAHKVLRIFPPGTMPIVVDWFKAEVEYLKEHPEVIQTAHHNKNLRKLQDKLGECFKSFDELTGGSTNKKEKKEEEMEEDEEDLPVNLAPAMVTVDTLVQEALALQDSLWDIMHNVTHVKLDNVEVVKKLFEDPSNRENLYKVLDEGNHKDDDESGDTIEIDKCLDEIWETDPALLRTIYSMISL